MDDKHRKLIVENVTELIEKTDNIDSIIELLKVKQVLNIYMVNYLNKYIDEKQKKTEFYEMILGRGPHAFNILIQTLRETKNYASENILNSNRVSYFVPTYPVVNQINRLTKEEDIINANNDDDDDVKVKIHPFKKFMDTNENAYKMRSKPRGVALIININIYTTSAYRHRFGSEKDYQKLTSLFSQLGYEIVADNSSLNSEKLKEKIKTFSLNTKLSTVDSLVVFIMCHGKQINADDSNLHLVASDGNLLKASWIIDQFSSKLCSFTKPKERKPKLFFFQACRIVRAVGNCMTDSEKRSKSSYVNNRDGEDVLIVYSTFPGYYSMRDPEEGTWFVDIFCKIVAEHAWEMDLLSMLEMVDGELSKKNDEQLGNQGMDIWKRSISFKIFFNPGLFE